MNLHRSKFALCVLLTIGGANAQLAKGATKFLGNITTSGNVRSDFINYWNQITPENESKWGSVEYNRGTFDWSGVDRVADYAKQNGIAWKFHTMVWGGQYPSWMDNLSQADQLTEITKWFDAAAARYPDVNMIDVVNEAMVGHNPAPFKNALGGDGASGVDWIVTAFKMARARWPKATLIYNDYNILEWNYSDAVTFISTIVNAGAPVDAIGSQSHALTSVDSATFHTRIDGMVAATGLPIFITELDIDAADDATQKDYYSKLFPVMWNHPSVAGVTMWGYVMGKTWETNSGLMSDANVDRPAMTWLKDYVANHKSPPTPKVGPSATFVTVPAHRDTVFNSKFDQGALGWTFNVWGGGAHGSVVNGEYKIQIDSIGQHNSSIQLVQNGIILEKGKSYKVTFDAHATSDRTLEANVEQDVSPWTSYLPALQTFDLTTNWTPYSYAFTMTNPTDSNGRVSFNVGASTETVYIDNVYINGIPADVHTKIGRLAGGLRWSAGTLFLSGTECVGSAQHKCGKWQIVDSHGRGRIVDVTDGRGYTGQLPKGVYQARNLDGKANDFQTFMALP